MTIPPLKIGFLDVGHGDCIVIILPDNNQNKRAIVIDTPDYKKTIDFLEQNNVTTIDLVLVSHFDCDHSKGISAVINHYLKGNREVKKICYKGDRISRSEQEQKNYRNLLRQLNSFDRSYKDFTLSGIIEGSQRNIKFSGIDNFSINILYPSQSDLDDACLRGNCNDTSTVIMVQYYEKKVLLPGDLEGKGWFYLIDRIRKYNRDIECGILKLPHHGDYYNSSNNELGTDQILDNTRPEFAIISSAENQKFQHPNKDTIIKLKEKRIYTFCTQVTGICQADRKSVKEFVIQELGCVREEYNENWCPCSGDIIAYIDDRIHIQPSFESMGNIKSKFATPKCV